VKAEAVGDEGREEEVALRERQGEAVGGRTRI
jgi:hypothetical protein